MKPQDGSSPVRPVSGWAFAAYALVVFVWGMMHLVVFRNTLLPLTYVVPLLICVGTKDRLALWSMAFVFLTMAAFKIFWVLPDNTLSVAQDWGSFGAQFANIVVAASIIHAIIGFRQTLERNNTQLTQANQEIERQNDTLRSANDQLKAANELLQAREQEINRQNEELQAQNEELRCQGEELQQQAEELQQQGEELATQSEELQHLNEELSRREAMLQTLLNASLHSTGEVEAMTDVCRLSLRLMGAGVTGAAVVEERGGHLHVHSQIGIRVEGPDALPLSWPLERSFARIAMESRRAEAISDLSAHPGMVVPAAAADGTPFRAILAAPLVLDQRPVGAVEFYALSDHDWNEDQFRLAEWVAAQCSAVLEMIRLRNLLQTSEQRYRQLFDVSRDGLLLHEWLPDPAQSRFLQANPAICELLGYTPGELRERSPLDIQSDIDPANIAAEARMMREQDHILFEKTLIARDGRRIPTEIHASMFVAGERRMALSSVRDVSQRNAAQEALRQSEARYRELVQNANSAILRWRRDGTITFFNEFAQSFFGYTAQEAIGRPVSMLVPARESTGADLTGLAQAIVENPERFRNNINENIRRDGQRVWMTWTNKAILNEQGEVEEILAIGSDITAQKRAEAALKESEAQARRIIDHTLSFVGVMTRDGTLVEANETALRAGGLTRQDVIGRKFWDCDWWNYDPRVQQQLREAIERAAAGEAVRYDVVVRMADNTRMPIDFMLAPVRNEAGEVAWLIPSGVDITQRKQAEEQLHQSHQRLTSHIQNSPLAVVEFDAQLRIVDWSEGARRMFGWDATEVQGRSLWELPWIHEDDREPLRQTIEDLAQGRVHRNTAPSRNLRKDGTVIWCEWYNSALTDEGGQLRSILSLALDVTQRHQALQDATLARSAAEDANRAKDHFLAVLSHELRTPLNPALMAASILESSPQLPAALQDDVTTIRRNVELEARLIDDLLDLTRIARGKLTLQRRIFDAREVIRHAVGVCEADAAEHALELHVTLPDAPAWVHVDSARLQQVIWNLLKNAIKFTPAGGRVSVDASVVSGATLRINVTDTGIGIEPTMLSRIFDAFEQGSNGGRRQFGGLGLGLAISKGLMEIHGGQLTGASDGPGTGARFTVELPLTEAPVEIPSDGPAPEGAASLLGMPAGNWRILLVEDHDMTARIVARLLRSFGHEVTVATTIAQAAAVFERERFDLLVSDLGLPDGDGRDLMRRIRELRPIRAIALSGYGMEADLQESAQAGFIEHMVKPINAQQLRDAIHRVMNSTLIADVER